MSKLVTFETAKLASEKGYRHPKVQPVNLEDMYYEPNRMTYHYNRYSKKYIPLSRLYSETNQNFEQYGDSDHPPYDIPTQQDLRKWLEVNHKIIVMPQLMYYDNEKGWNTYSVEIFFNDGTDKTFSSYETYEEAFEIGLKEGLTYIK